MIVSEEINANDKKNKSPKSNKKARNSTKMTKSILDHNDFDTEREDYELKFISLKEKLTKAEQTISELKNNTEDLEFKVFKKRGKIKTLKEELENLKMKMQLYENNDSYEKAREKMRKMKEKTRHSTWSSL